MALEPTLSSAQQTPREKWASSLRELARRNLVIARQEALHHLLLEEDGLTQQQLIARVEALLRRGCFDPNPQDAFQCDLAVIRERLAAAGHLLLCSPENGAYSIEGHPMLDEPLRRLIAGAVAAVDPRQIAIYRRLTPAQRVWQLVQLSDWLQQANRRRKNSS